MPKQQKWNEGDRVVIGPFAEDGMFYMAVVTKVLAKTLAVTYDSDESEERVRIDSKMIFGRPTNNRRNRNAISEKNAKRLCGMNGANGANGSTDTAATADPEVVIDPETWAVTYRGKAIGELDYVDDDQETFAFTMAPKVPKAVKAVKKVKEELEALTGKRVPAFARKMDKILAGAAA